MRLRNLTNVPYGIPLTTDPLWLPAMGETSEFSPDLLPDILKDQYVAGMIEGGCLLVIKSGDDLIPDPIPTPAPDLLPPDPAAVEVIPPTEEVKEEPAIAEAPAPEPIPEPVPVPAGNPWDTPAPAAKKTKTKG